MELFEGSVEGFFKQESNDIIRALETFWSSDKSLSEIFCSNEPHKDLQYLLTMQQLLKQQEHMSLCREHSSDRFIESPTDNFPFNRLEKSSVLEESILLLNLWRSHEVTQPIYALFTVISHLAQIIESVYLEKLYDTQSVPTNTSLNDISCDNLLKAFQICMVYLNSAWSLCLGNAIRGVLICRLTLVLAHITTNADSNVFKQLYSDILSLHHDSTPLLTLISQWITALENPVIQENSYLGTAACIMAFLSLGVEQENAICDQIILDPYLIDESKATNPEKLYLEECNEFIFWDNVENKDTIQQCLSTVFTVVPPEQLSQSIYHFKHNEAEWIGLLNRPKEKLTDASSKHEIEDFLHETVQAMKFTANRYGDILYKDNKLLKATESTTTKHFLATRDAVNQIKVFNLGRQMGFFTEMALFSISVAALFILFPFIFTSIPFS